MQWALWHPTAPWFNPKLRLLFLWSSEFSIFLSLPKYVASRWTWKPDYVPYLLSWYQCLTSLTRLVLKEHMYSKSSGKPCQKSIGYYKSKGDYTWTGIFNKHIGVISQVSTCFWTIKCMYVLDARRLPVYMACNACSL